MLVLVTKESGQANKVARLSDSDKGFGVIPPNHSYGSVAPFLATISRLAERVLFLLISHVKRTLAYWQ